MGVWGVSTATPRMHSWLLCRVDGPGTTVVSDLNKTWRLRREEVGLLPAGIWSVGRVEVGYSLRAQDVERHGGRPEGRLLRLRARDAQR